MGKLPRVDTIAGIESILENQHRVLPETKLGGYGTLYCPKCGAFRRVDCYARHECQASVEPSIGLKDNTPALFLFVCRECDMLFHGLLYPKKAEEGFTCEIIVLPWEGGGISTPNTHHAVKYYLDQAHRSFTIGARSAAVAMYRSAIEMMLFHEGYKDRMLGKKVAALEKDHKNGTGRPWVSQIDPEVIDTLNKLATSAIHPNDGKIEKQEEFDEVLVLAVEASMKELLDEVYEIPRKRKARSDFLKEKVGNLESV